ncbi:MAG: diguanylate cyclase [Candidatus Sedimenticola sp. (ex Thyasira tokunagai)]
MRGKHTAGTIAATAAAVLVGALLLILTPTVNADILTHEERQWLKENPRIRFAPAPNYPPVEFFDQNNQYRGVTADFVAHMKSLIGLDLEIVQLQNWNQVIENSKKRQVDVWGAAAQTAERSEYMNFTEPYIRLPAVIIVHKEVEGTLKMEELVGKKVVVIQGYASQKHIEQNFPELQLIAVPDIETGLRMVSFGAADSIVATNASAIYYIEKEGLTNLRVAGESGFEWRLRFAARNDWPQLISIIQKGLNSISEDKKREIYRRWISLGSSGWVWSWELVAKIATAAVLILLIAVLLWNRTLRHRVAVQTQVLKQDLRERKALEQQLRHLATTDPLTGIYNRRHLYDLAEKEVRRCLRYENNLSAIVLDVDYFKAINDNHGHAVGDNALVALVKTCNERLRSNDIFGRIGGEEFIILFPETDQVAAFSSAERIRRAVELLHIDLDNGKRLQLTISIGLASLENSIQDAQGLINRCDQMMYLAKESGRNCIVQYPALGP